MDKATVIAKVYRDGKPLEQAVATIKMEMSTDLPADDSIELSIEMQRHDGTWVMLLDHTLCMHAESTLKKAIAFAHDAGLEIKAKVNDGEWLTYENIEFLDFVEGLRRQLK